MTRRTICPLKPKDTVTERRKSEYTLKLIEDALKPLGTEKRQTSYKPAGYMFEQYVASKAGK